MKQTSNTAIVLRYANYREQDRMLTLFSPTRGRVEAVARGCRKPKSHLLSASELFSLGDFELFEKNGRATVIGFTPIESFYPLRADYDRLTCGVYLLALCEAAVQPGAQEQDLFMLLLHTLSRLAFTDQPWEGLVTGFLHNYAACQGMRPRLRHCIRCGRRVGDEEPASFDLREGGLVCADHGAQGLPRLTPADRRFLRHAEETPASQWLAAPDRTPPLGVMRQYVESRLDLPLRAKLPEVAR